MVSSNIYLFLSLVVIGSAGCRNLGVSRGERLRNCQVQATNLTLGIPGSGSEAAHALSVVCMTGVNYTDLLHLVDAPRPGPNCTLTQGHNPEFHITGSGF